MSILEQYRKKKEFLICIDSDGCAMDTMDCKHFYCFGPCMVKEWGLEVDTDRILKRWNEVNLYSMTRGINRLLGLSMALQEVDQQGREIPGITAFSRWAQEAAELSGDAVMRQYEATGLEIYQKAANWSKAVNAAIDKLPEELKKPFPGAAQGIAAAGEAADVAIVSSANREAVLEEWEKFHLMDHVDICLTQSEGSKAYCIGEMLKFGYEPDHVLMVGDAPGDAKAAAKNGVLYYPILVKREEESWKRFVDQALPKFLEGSYAGEYEEARKREFEENLQ